MNDLTIPMNQYLAQPDVSKYLDQLLGERKGQFVVALSTIMNGNYQLAECDRKSILDCALQAVGMNLSMSPSLGHCYPVPYNTKDGKKAQFQMGWKGFIQLALRTGQYKFINVSEVYENQFESFDKFNETLKADFTIDGKGKIVGYVAKFILNSGFEKTLFWTMNQIQNHGRTYSKSFTNDKGLWKNDFDSMAKKTVLKQLVSKFGAMSTELEEAITRDQAIIERDYATGTEKIVYVDNPQSQDYGEQPTVESVKSFPITDEDVAEPSWTDKMKTATPVPHVVEQPSVRPNSDFIMVKAGVNHKLSGMALKDIPEKTLWAIANKPVDPSDKWADKQTETNNKILAFLHWKPTDVAPVDNSDLPFDLGDF